jgi:Protein of unknown function (DUF3489)
MTDIHLPEITRRFVKRTATDAEFPTLGPPADMEPLMGRPKPEPIDPALVERIQATRKHAKAKALQVFGAAVVEGADYYIVKTARGDFAILSAKSKANIERPREHFPPRAPMPKGERKTRQPGATKNERMIAMAKRPDGASNAELSAMTGWNSSIGTLRRFCLAKGIVMTERAAAGEKRYFIAQ